MPIPTLTSAIWPTRRRLGRVALLTALAAATWLIAASPPVASGQTPPPATATEAATGTPPPAGNAPATPAAGPLRFEDSDPAVIYAGAWTTVAESRASGGTFHRSNQLNATTWLSFAGTSVTWITSRGPNRGIARVQIDANAPTNVDLYAASEAFQQEVTYSNLADTSHLIQIQVSGTRSGGASDNFVDVDAFVVPSGPAAATSTPGPTAPTPVGTAAAQSSPTVPPGATAAPPSAPRDSRYFFETSYRVDSDAFWDYFQAQGGVDTFGFPISRTFLFLGCTSQFFQRQLLQQCGTGARVQTMNLLDPDLMPYNQINFSTFPAHDPSVAGAAPAPETPSYGAAVLDYLRRVAPDSFQGLAVRFYTTFVTTVPGSNPQANPDLTALVNLEIWGFPTSNPAFDPANGNFVYQRFQRGIMHFDNATGATRGILLADYFKGLIVGQPGTTLPPDLLVQAATSRFFRQYCPGQPGWTCRPNDLPGTDLTFAFEPE